MADLWIVLATDGLQIVEPAVFDNEGAAREHYNRLVDKMDTKEKLPHDVNWSWSVQKVRAEDKRGKSSDSKGLVATVRCGITGRH